MSDYDVERMWSWVLSITARGTRRPGSAAGRGVENDLAAHLSSFGYETRLEPIPVTLWDPTTVRLEVQDGGGAPFCPGTQAVPYTPYTPSGGVEAPLLWVDPQHLPDDSAWRGAIVLTEITFPPINADLLLKISLGQYDPDHNLKDLNHPATWVRVNWHLYREAETRGAAGFVGILRDQPGGSCRMFAPYGFREADILDKLVPAVWVGRSDGARLKALVESRARARLTVEGVREASVTHNVIGELPGKSCDQEVIVLSCHHDSPFVSPVEDASGNAVVLALAERFARMRDLNRRLVVLFSAGHFYGSIGTRTFIRSHPELVKRTVLEISIEHIAKEAVEDRTGALVPTGRPEPTAMFVSFSPKIAAAVLGGVKSHNVDRVVLLPAAGPLGDYPPTDGGDWYEAGVPVINCISNPVYLLTDQDDFSWVDRPRMTAMAAAFEQMIRQLDGVGKEQLADREGSVVRRFAMHTSAHLAHLWATRFGRRRFY